MEQTKDIFGKRLFELRESRGESQQELADSMGITRQSLSRYELGERTANIDLLKKIAEHYDVSADYLLGLTNNATTDANVQSVCKYTGLTDEAVRKIVYARSEGLFDEELDMLSWLISEGYVLELCALLSGIRINSEEYIRQLKEYEELKKLCANQEPENIKRILKDKWLEYQLMDDNLDTTYNDVDVERYRLVKFTEALSDIFDDRKQTNGKDPDLLYTINKIKRKFDDINLYYKVKESVECSKKETCGNGKHNSPKE